MFKDRELKNAILRIAIPVALQNMLTSFVNMIDTIMIGSLGDRAVAAVGLANQWFFIFNLIVFGIASGSSIYIAQFYGKRDYESMHTPIAYSLFLCSVVSVVFGLAALIFPEFVMRLFTNNPETIACGISYLRISSVSYIMFGLSLPISSAMRSTEFASLPLIVTVLSLIVNAALNYTLIYGHFGAPVLGVAGAAIATSCARILETLIIFVFMFLGKCKINVKPRHFKIQKAFIPEYIRTVLPVIGNEGMWGLGISAYSAIFGHMNDSIVAARQISGNLEQILTALCFGLGSAGAVVIGKKIGEKNQSGALLYSKKFAIISVVTGFIIGIIMIVTTPLFLSFFSVSDATKEYATILIVVTGIFMCVKMFNYMNIVGILRSGGDTRYCFVLDVCTVWGIGVLSLFLCAFVFKTPFIVLALCLVFEEVIKLIFGLKRLISKKWLNDLVN